MQPITPAVPAFTSDGIPLSTAFDDVYHSTKGALGQAAHVFLRGNDLPARWRGRRVFTILETGFGLGLNFIATWQTWRAEAIAERCERLHFVSIEKHPFEAADLRAMLQKLLSGQPDLTRLAAELTACWPPALPGLHRIEFDEGRVVLTVAFGDIATVAPRLTLRADAFYFDGFAPAKNPQMWSQRVFSSLAKLAAPGATFATYTAAGSVREALSESGFVVEKVPGYAGKLHMLRGALVPTRQPDRRPEPPLEHHALIVGAGLAGCGVTERLAARGWRVTLIDRHDQPAQEASGNLAGTFHPVVSRDDNLLARLTRNAFLYGARAWAGLERRGHAPLWAQCGVLQLPGERRRGAGLPDMAGWPADYVKQLNVDDASARCGVLLKQGGLWFPGGGWIVPGTLCAAQLAAAGDAVTTHFATEVAHCEYADGNWRVFDRRENLIAKAPVLILANALDAARLMPQLSAALRAVRGQLTYLPPEGFERLAACLCGNGYLLPNVKGRVVAGATYEPDDDDVATRDAGHAENLARVANILASALPKIDSSALTGRAALRAVTSDRMPLIGAIPAPANSAQNVVRAKRLPHAYCATGFASRGILWGTLAGEVLASQLEGEPAPVESDLLRAIDPARFSGTQA
jgi:tRNA 5-methylaminomethyl-2-thiouridine biosynthesis bifunctional protein